MIFSLFSKTDGAFSKPGSMESFRVVVLPAFSSSPVFVQYFCRKKNRHADRTMTDTATTVIIFVFGLIIPPSSHTVKYRLEEEKARMLKDHRKVLY